MGKEIVTCSVCGKNFEVTMGGPHKERDYKVKNWTWTCPDCYEDKKSEGCEEVEMLYSKYKNEYSDCKTKADTYDKKAKTIIVYVPVDYVPGKKTASVPQKPVAKPAIDRKTAPVSNPDARVRLYYDPKLKLKDREYVEIMERDSFSSDCLTPEDKQKIAELEAGGYVFFEQEKYKVIKTFRWVFDDREDTQDDDEDGQNWRNALRVLRYFDEII